MKKWTLRGEIYFCCKRKTRKIEMKIKENYIVIQQSKKHKKR